MAVNQNPSQQSVQNSQQIVDNTDKLKESLKEVLFLQRDFAEEAKKAAKAVFESNIQAAATYKSFKDLSNATKDISVSYADIITGQKTLRELQKDIEKQDKARKSLLIETQQALHKIGATPEQINEALSKQGGIYDYLYNTTNKIKNEQFDLLALHQEQLDALDGQSKDLSEIQKQAKVINDAFGTLGNTVEGIEKGLNKAGFGNLTSRLGLSEAVKKTREYAAEITKGGTKASTIGDKFKIAGELAKNVGGNLIKSFDPVSLAIIGLVKLFQFIKDAMFGASKQVAEFQRGLMVSSEEAEKIRQRAYDISAESSNLADTQGKVLILQKQIVEAMNATNNALDTQIDFTQDLGEFGEKILAQSAILKDNMGLEAEAQAEITRESIRTGKEIEQITKSSYGNIAAIGLGKKIQLDVNKLLTEATKIQGNLRLSYKGSTEELAKAVAQSKLLGVNLSQLEKVQSSLLNFEESISAELEAELLTGRDFNLERARTLALEGDLVGMAEALNAQGITYNKLQSYNIIQRQAIAKALGMEVNELADALKKQEEYNQLQLRARLIGIETNKLEKQSLREIFEEGKKIGRSEEEIIKLLGDEIYQRKLAEDAQTKFNKALEMAKEQFQSFVSSGVLDKFASFLTVFVNKVAKDGLGSALFADYGEEIAKDQLKKAEERQNQIGPTSTTERDILVAKKDVLESSRSKISNIPVAREIDLFLREFNYQDQKKGQEIELLTNTINKLNQQLEKGITANAYLEYDRLNTNMNINKNNG
jgi:hypothetical protein